MKEINLYILKALSGDSLFLSFKGNDNEVYHVLIDGGMPNTFNQSIKKILENIDYLNYIFLTHIDRDHIGGILKLISSSYKNKIKNIFFNSGNLIKIQNSTLISENDGKELVKYINESTSIKSNKKEITIETNFDFGGLKVSFLSPTYQALKLFNENYSLGTIKEEALISDSTNIETDLNLEELSKLKFNEKSLSNDISNGVSLAMLLEYSGKKILLLGDAKDSVLIQSLVNQGYKNQAGKRLNIDYIKLSHHGSKYHTNNEFLSLIECSNFIISTNGSGNFKHPNIEIIARILCHPNRNIEQKIFFYFNYPKEEYIRNNIRLLTENEEEKYNCKSIYDKTLLRIGMEND